MSYCSNWNCARNAHWKMHTNALKGYVDLKIYILGNQKIRTLGNNFEDSNSRKYLEK